MYGTPTLQPMPANPEPDADEYESPSDGCAPPRAAGSEIGTLNVAIPVESCAEKLSPIPWILPAPDGTEMAWLLTPVLSAPLGRLMGVAAADETLLPGPAPGVAAPSTSLGVS